MVFASLPKTARVFIHMKAARQMNDPQTEAYEPPSPQHMLVHTAPLPETPIPEHLVENTTDPTGWRYPELSNGDRTVHIRTLEAALARTLNERDEARAVCAQHSVLNCW